jgi:triacylglycerol lipase
VRTIEHIYLVPGFFGFVNFGRIVYFTHVREFLERTLDSYGVRAEIHRVRISPTASLRRRASELAASIAATAPPGAPIHIIGHSTGGLDARMFTAPGVTLGDDVDTEALARNVRTVVSVASPHYGTPLASFFTGMLGQRLLQLLSLVTVEILRGGRLPVRVVASIGASIARLGFPGGKIETVFDELYNNLLDELPKEEREDIATFLGQVFQDQSLLPQLMPEGIEIFNTSTANRPGVRYGCVVAHSRPPGLRGRLVAGGGVYGQATYTLYSLLHGRVAVQATRWKPAVTPVQRAALVDAYRKLPDPTHNDGIVPVYSQVWGEIIHATRCDHLDVIGHFAGERLEPPHYDWLCSGTGFTQEAFDELWTRVARFIAER